MSVLYMGNENHILCEKMMENTWIFGTVWIFWGKMMENTSTFGTISIFWTHCISSFFEIITSHLQILILEKVKNV